MSLPIEFVDHIFSKLTLIYGRDFSGRWEGMNIADVKADWAHELDGLDKSPKRIAYALKNLPTSKPPTVLEFRATVWKMPAETNNALLEMKAHRGAAPSLETLAKIAAIRATAKAMGAA